MPGAFCVDALLSNPRTSAKKQRSEGRNWREDRNLAWPQAQMGRCRLISERAAVKPEDQRADQPASPCNLVQ